MAEEISFQPIGYLRSEGKYRYDTPRQSNLADNRGVVVLNPGHNFEQALEDLKGFERIWLIYSFHLNDNWKTKVRPPRSEKKIGVFATRSPHRPNNIGMSCVELEKVDGLKLFIRNFDLLDNTPILDIKPYVPYCDSFPDSKTGWIPPKTSSYLIVFEKLFSTQAQWIKKETGFDLFSAATVQLEEDPLNRKRKRITEAKNPNEYIFAYRTWRILFGINEKEIILKRITTGYSQDDLNDKKDTYNDKEIHKNFIRLFEKEQ